MTTDELNKIVQAVMLELEKAGVDFDFKAETPQADDLVYVMRGTADKYQGITVKWQNLLDIIVQKATDAKDEAVSAKDIALQTLATIQGIESNVSLMKSSVETTKSQVETMKGEVSTMKASVETSEANVTQMKSDVSEMKTSVEGTKTEVEGLKSDVTNLKAQTQTIVDNAEEQVTGLLDTKVDKSSVLTYDDIIASTPPMDLDSAVASASALKTTDDRTKNIFTLNYYANGSIYSYVDRCKELCSKIPAFTFSTAIIDYDGRAMIMGFSYGNYTEAPNFASFIYLTVASDSPKIVICKNGTWSTREL